jgi:hypothetical protein
MALVVMMAPVAPTGWPSEMPEPLGLTLAGSKPSSLATAQAWAAKASLASITSMSAPSGRALGQHLARGGHGADAHVLGLDAGVRVATRRARGLRPRAATRSPEASTTAPAPSLMPEALPAVTVPPSFLKAGFMLGQHFTVVSARTCSSVSNSTVPLRVLISTGTICSLK